MTWTNDRTDQLKQLWYEGHSASAIARHIGSVTRNAVIGKIHRLGLAGRRAAILRKGTRSRNTSFFPTHAPRPHLRCRSVSRPTRFSNAGRAQSRIAPTRSKATRILPELGPAPERPVTVLMLNDLTCHWPEGDPKKGDFHFCGRMKGASSLYCPHHAARAVA